MLKLDRNSFFNILQRINKPCSYKEYEGQSFNDVPKFKELLDMIDLNVYSFDYIQNRFIIIKRRNKSLNEIKTLLLCNFDTLSRYQIELCENVKYDYYTKPKRKTYLTKPIEEKDRKEFTERTNEKDCIKGTLNSSILNSVAIYMLNNLLIKEDTAVIFTLKSDHTSLCWNTQDILEYLQSYVYNTEPNIFENIIELNLSSLPKGMPKKDYNLKLTISLRKYPESILNIKYITKINDNFKEKTNYTLDINRSIVNNNFHMYRDLVNYYNFKCLYKPRLFIFTDLPPTNKFATFFLDKPILVEYESIENYINIIYNILTQEGGMSKCPN